jgi:probable rRNA maturation factor
MMKMTKRELVKKMHEIAIQMADENWLTWYTTEEWQDRLSQVISGTLKAIEWKHPSEVSVLLTNNLHSQELNYAYRGENKPTNVLSFPAFSKEELEKLTSLQSSLILGDIVLALEKVLDEAGEQGKPFLHHITHLVVHGTLHLLGYDHEKDEEAESMENLEINVLDNLGISNPYQ